MAQRKHVYCCCSGSAREIACSPVAASRACLGSARTQITTPKRDRWHLLCVRVLGCVLRPLKKQLEKESPWGGRQGLRGAGEEMPGLAAGVPPLQPAGAEAARRNRQQDPATTQRASVGLGRLARSGALRKASELRKATPAGKEQPARSRGEGCL